MYRAFHSTASDYTFLLSAHGTFSRTDRMPGHKTSCNKFEKIEIISSIFFNHSGVKVEISDRRKTRCIDTWKLINTLWNNQWVKEEIKREIKKISVDKEKWKHSIPKLMECSKSSFKRKVYNEKCLH